MVMPGATHTIDSLYDVYVDSVGGDDANPGTALAPVKSLSVAQSMASLIGSSAKIGAKRGSYWQESLNWPYVGAYGVGIPPVIDCSDVLTGWALTEYENTYVATSLVETTLVLTSQYFIWQDDHEMVLGSSASTLTAGTYYVDTSGSYPVVYVHTFDSDSPVSHEICINNRMESIWTFSGSADVRDVVTRRSLDHNGSIYLLSTSSQMTRCLCESGGKHNAYIGGGSVNDCIMLDINRDAVQSYMFVAYFNGDWVDVSVDINGLYCIGRPETDELLEGYPAGAFFNHYVGAGSYGAFTVRQLAVKDVFYPGQFGGTVPADYQGVYLENTRAFGSGYACTIKYLQVNGHAPDGPDFYNWGNSAASEIQHWAQYDGVRLGTSSGNTIENSVLYNITHGGAELTQTSITSNYNVLVSNSSLSNKSNIRPSGYTGDFNVFYCGPSYQLHIQDASTGEHTTLASWQAASGQDANSVWLTDAQLASFFTGNLADGDFSINPSAQVTGADGTIFTGTFADGTTPITNAGPQYHWDWNLRAAVSGTPQRWPVIPDDMDSSVTYILDPTGWDFYL